ncbi:DUF4255 domain-containing protein [Streptomyces sp. F-1]|uniref:DUF4255 domain-containing protein n=1 Tax=Streptomyces sp. F-1 TaxID=463642 RepID=UPI00085BEF87|nr:DUF4255 domain-containing protein [Streptomyces sp. F-1]SFY49561.1 hypothetical protein STEPF1_02800 [Streptomyces sp. F-1]
MSNALAIAHVSQALALLIESHLQPEIDMAVKVEPRKPPAEPPAEPTISVFLYQVTPNSSRRNDDLPTRAPDGTLVRRASAALDLNYVISAYGDETELVGQRLLGSVVRTLHEIPVLPKDVIELAGEKPYLAGSNLAESAQRVRFTPNVMDIDETSKLWGMLYQTPYALSVVYQASLVLIDGRQTPTPARSVERPEVRVLPLGAPVPPGPGTEGAPRRDGAGAADPAPAQQTKASAESAAERPAKAPAKAPARALAKAPARARKSTSRAAKAAQPPARRTNRDADGTEHTDDDN